MKIVPQSVTLEHVTPNAAQVIEAAGRTCYKTKCGETVEATEAFVDRIANQLHHHSVIEHAVASFRIICDRGVSHELVRHRIASFSQESTRYCNYAKEKFGEEITVIRPPGLEEGTIQGCDWEDAMFVAESNYLKLLKRGIAPQIARSVLPTCLKTELVMTANFREWLHVIDQRTAKAAHPQAREVIGMVADILARECPVIFAGKKHET